MPNSILPPAGQPLCVSQLSQLFGLTTRAIRFYESRGLVRSVRDHTNKRWFDDKARRQLQFIAKMRRAGLTISAISAILDRADQEGSKQDYMALAVESLTERLETLDGERLEVLNVLAAIAGGEPVHRAAGTPASRSRRQAQALQVDLAEF